MQDGRGDRGQGAGGISIHAVDVAHGVPAAGLAMQLWLLNDGRTEIASGTCDEAGHLKHHISEGIGVVRGIYQVEFQVGAYYRQKRLELPDPSFLETAIFRFGIDRVNEHFHLPFKFTPWGFSLFRGGA